MSLRLGALSLIVPDYDAAIAWFRDALGWSCQEDVAMGDKRWVRVVSPCGAAALATFVCATRSFVSAMPRRDCSEATFASSCCTELAACAPSSRSAM